MKPNPLKPLNDYPLYFKVLQLGALIIKTEGIVKIEINQMELVMSGYVYKGTWTYMKIGNKDVLYMTNSELKESWWRDFFTRSFNRGSNRKRIQNSKS